MFEINESRSSATCLGLKVRGKLAASDYRALKDRLDGMIKAHGSANLVIVIEDFDGWGDLGAVREDIQLGFQEYKHIDRAAYVTEKRWHAFAVKILDPITRHTEEKVFEPQNIDDAWDWACAG